MPQPLSQMDAKPGVMPAFAIVITKDMMHDMRSAMVADVKIFLFIYLFLRKKLICVLVIKIYKTVNCIICNAAYVAIDGAEKTCGHFSLFEIILDAWGATVFVAAWVLRACDGGAGAKREVHLQDSFSIKAICGGAIGTDLSGVG